MDREAQRRGNSTYLVGKVIPMLPESLSNGICSLSEDVDRLVKSVLITFSQNGKVQKIEFANSVIRSNKRLTYRQAYALLEEDNLDKIRKLPGSSGSPDRLDRSGARRRLSKAELEDLQKWVRQLWVIRLAPAKPTHEPRAVSIWICPRPASTWMPRVTPIGLRRSNTTRATS